MSHAAKAAPVLSLAGVSSRRGGTPVLRDVSLDLGHEVVAVLGLNGCGKSTLLRTISGLTPTTGGTITLDERPIAGKSGHEVVRLGVGYVQQSNQFFPSLSVEENLQLGGYLLGRREARRAAAEQLAAFPRLAERRSTKAGALSGGERQMLALARALVRRPRVLLIDEISAGLAPAAVAESYEMIRALRIPVLLAEQNVAKALEVADRAVVMFLGAIRCTVDVAERGTEQLDYVRRMMMGEDA